LVAVRGWGQRVLQEELPPPESGVATALLLGEGSTMTGPEYEKYIRTGVIHVLAISGQHLAVLAWFAWGTLRLLGVRRRRGAVLVMAFLLGYALLTGGRPPAMRAAVMVCVIGGGILLRRPPNAANALALAWVVVALLNPTDLFTAGCQLSFLAVALLYWGTDRWFRRPIDPLERLVEETRPRWEQWLRAAGRWLLLTYAASALIWLAATPLAASRYHLVSPAGVLLTPPLLLLTSVALIAGFLLLLAAAVCWPLTPLFAVPTRWSLAGCEWLVNRADGFPGSYWYVGDVPAWWLAVFYAGLLAVLLIEPLRPRWRWVGVAWLAWFCVGFLSGSDRPGEPALRCTFLAVGHGGCTVLETPDGRVLLYDAGAMSGPDVTRRHIAPYLWHRGIRRVDEVFISHAHVDHFNGLAALLERFPVAQVTCPPGFADSSGPGARLTLELLRRRRVPLRVVKAGDRLIFSAVAIEVLHPPAFWTEGNEDARSLVLRVRHEDHTILLTGDLQGPGLRRLVDLPRSEIDVLMAPHHGSRLADPEGLADWARPEVVISCQGPPRWPTPTPRLYENQGARFLGTWPHGAVTVVSRRDELIVETYRTGERYAIR
jgi:competence protein ComEC